MLKAIRWMAVGAGLGFVTDRVMLELRKPAPEQFPWLREKVNTTVNPWLMERGIPGSAKAEIATLEHVGRKSGTTYFTPVHPTIHEDTVLVPAPLGVGSQWARNVLDAGHARLQLHETLYELDRPELVTIAESGQFPPAIAGPFDRMGWRYVRMHKVAEVPGSFATHKLSMPAVEDHPMPEPPLEGSYEIPIEPKMADHAGS